MFKHTFRHSRAISGMYSAFAGLGDVVATLHESPNGPSLASMNVLRVMPSGRTVYTDAGGEATVAASIYVPLNEPFYFNNNPMYIKFGDMPDTVFTVAGISVVADSIAIVDLVERQYGDVK